ncbi:hypothetical protein DE146DRAFT_461672 [Phaeosphaeria sp. MPI-PUGE-AT-0046c]|nr:hypothetical protein DE146DRAFT_461672 [Phaeosphaeria sp. MPI-PUGE-AT-0046c]
MVGVPGRSKGCHTCKKRKKKCDLGRPLCGNCTKGAFVCGGYEKPIVMVHADEQGRGSYHQQMQRTSGSLIRRPSHYAALLDIRYKKLNRTTSELVWSQGWGRGMTPIPPIDGRRLSTDTEPVVFGEWWTDVYEAALKSELLRCSLLSASGYLRGNTLQDYTLRNRGLELYHEAIRLMTRALASPRAAKDRDAAYALFMSGYLLETVEFLTREYPDISARTTPASRFSRFFDEGDVRITMRSKGHFEFMLGLMQSMDPEAFKHPGLHQIFLQYRQVSICWGFADRKSTFLSSEEWMTKPWIGLRRSYLDTLWDNIVYLPNILEAVDDLNRTSPAYALHHRATLLLHQCYELEWGLDNWQNKLSTVCPSMTEEESVRLRHCIDTMSPAELSDVLFTHGSSYLLAWMLHWASRIILYSILPGILMQCPPDTPDNVTHNPRSISSYSLGIARSAKHILGRKNHEIGLWHDTLLRIPVAVVQQVLQHPLRSSMNDPDLNEAEIILANIGKAELELEVREFNESPWSQASFAVEIDDSDSSYSSCSSTRWTVASKD